jgi:hypothetical protein
MIVPIEMESSGIMRLTVEEDDGHPGGGIGGGGGRSPLNCIATASLAL